MDLYCSDATVELVISYDNIRGHRALRIKAVYKMESVLRPSVYCP